MFLSKPTYIVVGNKDVCLPGYQTCEAEPCLAKFWELVLETLYERAVYGF